jgi:hypothetical protein
MHEAEQYQYNSEMLNEYYECDILEREARDALLRGYREWDAAAEQGKCGETEESRVAHTTI